MTDLNDWRLQYGATSFDFGSLSSTFPLSVQVDIGSADLSDQDQPHPTSDGVIMGRDSLGGFDLNFDLTTLPTFPPGVKPWNAAMDLFSGFKSKWRADSIRRVPGVYATLLNLDRNRLVYGRPRKIGQKMALARRGIVGYSAVFTTNDPNFYSGTEKIATITPVPASSGGLLGPLVSPLTVVGSTLTVDAAVNDGDLGTWPVVEFSGPFNTASLELIQGATIVWKMVIPDKVHFDEVITVDTRPWSRSATINGRPANGRVRGTQLEKCQLPVGTYQWRYKVTDRTGTAFARMKWRDAYASL